MAGVRGDIILHDAVLHGRGAQAVMHGGLHKHGGHAHQSGPAYRDRQQQKEGGGVAGGVNSDTEACYNNNSDYRFRVAKPPCASAKKKGYSSTAEACYIQQHG